MRLISIAESSLQPCPACSALKRSRTELRANSPRDRSRWCRVAKHGSVKSLVAMEFSIAALRSGPSLPSDRAGNRAGAHRAEFRSRRLRTAGFDVSHFVPRLFEASDVADALLVVSFDQDIAKIVAVKHGTWRGTTYRRVLADYARGRDEIVRHVDELSMSSHGAPRLD